VSMMMIFSWKILFNMLGSRNKHATCLSVPILVTSKWRDS
jgi:hypothetical protein